MPARLQSRKLWITIGIILLVAVSDLIGSPLDDASLEAVITMGLGLLGAQGLVDTAAAFAAGKKVAEVAEEVKDSTDE